MILFAITTLNHNDYTEALLKSLHETDIYKKGKIDILIVDDYSQEDDVKFLAHKYNAKFIGKKKPRGLTDSWNRAYHFFKNNLYNNLYIANNDILIPKGCIENIEQLLIRFHSVSPLCNPKGVGDWPPILQYDISRRYPFITELADNKECYNEVQNMLKDDYEETHFFHGFLMCFTRDIILNELPGGDLFHPLNINIGNETELNIRFKGKKGIALNAFIYHHKGITLNKRNRNHLMQFHQ
jgi:hypothetical protein|tara:strand:+ start:54 stop:773 length:720 start_codon:yes stop_codon:yes gene_type:complete